jgi:hypothetical protein
MKKLVAFIFAATITVSSVGQKRTLQTDTLDNIVIKGEINNIQFLKKDWQSNSKVYQIYWVEISLVVDSSYRIDQSFPINKTFFDSIPKVLIFISESSGLMADLDDFKKIEVGEKVSIQTKKTYITRFIKKEKKNILIHCCPVKISLI